MSGPWWAWIVIGIMACAALFIAIVFACAFVQFDKMTLRGVSDARRKNGL